MANSRNILEGAPPNKLLLMTAQQQKAEPHEPAILCLRGMLQTTETFLLIEHDFCILLKSTSP